MYIKGKSSAITNLTKFLMAAMIMWVCPTSCKKIPQTPDSGLQEKNIELITSNLDANIFNIVMDSHFFDSFELTSEDPEISLEKLSNTKDLAYSKISTSLIEDSSPLRAFADELGEVTILYSLDDLEIIDDASASYYQNEHPFGETLKLARRVHSGSVAPSFRDPVIRLENVKDLEKRIRWLNDDHSDWYTPRQLERRKQLEDLADVHKKDLVLYRFVDKAIANKQLKSQSFSDSDYNHYFNQFEPGPALGRRAGRGVYAVKPGLLYSVGNIAENSLKRAGVKVLPGEATGLLKIIVKKGTKYIDLKDPRVLKRLRKNNFSMEEISYLDPNISIRFHEFPKHDFWVLKNISDRRNVLIKKPNPKDFENLTPAQVSKFRKNGRELAAHFKKFAPENIQKITLKKNIFSAAGSLIIKPLVAIYKFILNSSKIHQRLANLFYYAQHARLAKLNENSNLSIILNKKTTLFDLKKSLDNKEINYYDPNNGELNFRNNRETIFFAGGIEELNKRFPPPKYRLTTDSIKKQDIKNVLASHVKSTEGISLPESNPILFVDIIRNPNMGKINNIPSNQKKFKANEIIHYYDKHYSKPYSLENRTVSYKNDVDILVSHRPNHGLSHGIRSGALSVDSVMLANTHLKHTEFGRFCEKNILMDPNFIKKIEHYSISNRAARIGEGADKDIGGTTQRNAYNFFNDPYSKIIIPNVIERKKYARAFFTVLQIRSGKKMNAFLKKSNKNITNDEKKFIDSLDLEKNPLTKEEKFLGTISYLGHFNDHRRINFWSRKVSFAEQREMLKGVGLGNREANSLIYTLWTRSGTYLKATGAGDADIFTHLGKRQSAWEKYFGSIKNRYSQTKISSLYDNRYRHVRSEDLFFKSEMDAVFTYENIKIEQAHMSYDRQLLNKFESEIDYLMYK
ncbi:MAG: SidE phosphodiesterase domain-containing protein [Oligoflexales bacterium]